MKMKISSSEKSTIAHTMIRVCDLDRSISFYTNLLGMRLRQRKDYPGGGYTLAFLGYGNRKAGAVEIELTHNWDGRTYDRGNGFGHLAIFVADIHGLAAGLHAAGVRVTRAPGPRAGEPDEIIAFIEDPDGYMIELIQQSRLAEDGRRAS